MIVLGFQVEFWGQDHCKIRKALLCRARVGCLRQCCSSCLSQLDLCFMFSEHLKYTSMYAHTLGKCPISYPPIISWSLSPPVCTPHLCPLSQK